MAREKGARPLPCRGLCHSSSLIQPNVYTSKTGFVSVTFKSDESVRPQCMLPLALPFFSPPSYTQSPAVPHRPRLVVSRSTCPPLTMSYTAPLHHTKSFVIGTAVINLSAITWAIKRATGAWSSTCPSRKTALAPAATCSRTVCYRIPRTSMRLCALLRSAKLTAIGNNTRFSSRAIHCRWHAIATQPIGLVPIQARCILPVLKSKVGLAAAKAAALRINLNIVGCGIVAAPVHAPSSAPLLLRFLLSHNLPLPRVHECRMGRLVHKGLCSSSFVAHVLHYPPPPTRTSL